MTLLKTSNCWIASVLLLFLLSDFALGQAVIYVNDDAAGANNGSSWEDAYTDLQAALFLATSGNQIWVATGTYKPEIVHGGTGSRYKSFQMKNGVTIYGGFPNTGDPNLLDRNPQLYETILSGDIGVEGLASDNCYHVVYNQQGTNLDTTAVLDGFTITAGFNDIAFGGGMANEISSPTISNCVFRSNSATIGGGMWNYDCSPILTNCTFYNNSASSLGGGLGNSVYCSPTVTNCTFYNNTAEMYGGGIYNEGDSSCTVTNCILWADSAGTAGDEIYNNDISTSSVTYSDVQGGYGGPDANNIDADPCFVDTAGGDFHLLSDSPCIDVGTNSAPNLPPLDFEGQPRIFKGIVDMGADEFVTAYELTTSTNPEQGGTITLSPPGGYYPEGAEVNVAANPTAGYMFDHWSGDLIGSTNPDSIVMDANKAVTAHFTFTGIIYVDDDASGSNDGSCWEDAFTDLQVALSATTSGLQIWVAAGTYKPTIEHGGTGSRYKSFQIKKGVAIYGGFTGHEDPNSFDLGDRDFTNNETILSGDIGTTGVNTDNCYHVFYHWSTDLDISAVLDGFTVSGGYANGTDHNAYGAGMYNYSSNPTINNCTFTGNSTYPGENGTAGKPGTAGGNGGNGAGMYNDNSSPILTNCTFSDNSTGAGGAGGRGVDGSYDVDAGSGGAGGNGGSGAGMYNYNSSPILTNCTFSGNLTGVGGRGGSGGKGISLHSDGGNGATGGAGGSGAAIYNYTSSPTLINCIFGLNSTGAGGRGGNGGSCEAFSYAGRGAKGGNAGSGAAINNYNSLPAVINCIFQGNVTGQGGNGGNGGHDNYGDDGVGGAGGAGGNGGNGAAINNSGSSHIVTNCTFYGNSTGTGGAGGLGGSGSKSDGQDGADGYPGSGGGMNNFTASSPILTNCILWNDSPGEISNSASSPVVTHCDVQGGYGGPDANNINSDPLFTDPFNGDFHLLSDSPCIDAGSNSAPNLPPSDFEGHPRIFNGIADMGADEFALIIYVNASACGNNDGIKWEDAFTDLQDALNAAFEGYYEICVAAGTYKPTSGVDRSASFQLKDGISVYGGFPNIGNPLWDERDWQANPTILSGDIGTEGVTTDNCYHVLYNAVETASSQFLAANESGGSGRSALLDGFIITGGNADGTSENSRGGGVYNFFFDLTMMNCRLENNSAVSGGGIANLSCFPTLINCLITANTAQDGGGMYNLMAFPNVINCTFSRNTASNGSGMFNGILSEPYVTNCILWGDTGGEIYNDAESFAEVNFSDVEGGYGSPDANNIDADPLFVDPDGGDLRLLPDSPCIDRGDSNAVPPEVTTDLDGNPRILDGDCSGIAAVDMGAYEFSFAYIGDFDGECDVDFVDFAILALAWLTEPGQTGWNPDCDISIPADNSIDWRDLDILSNNWLAGL